MSEVTNNHEQMFSEQVKALYAQGWEVKNLDDEILVSNQVITKIPGVGPREQSPLQMFERGFDEGTFGIFGANPIDARQIAGELCEFGATKEARTIDKQLYSNLEAFEAAKQQLVEHLQKNGSRLDDRNKAFMSLIALGVPVADISEEIREGAIADLVPGKMFDSAFFSAYLTSKDLASAALRAICGFSTQSLRNFNEANLSYEESVHSRVDFVKAIAQKYPQLIEELRVGKILDLKNEANISPWVRALGHDVVRSIVRTKTYGWDKDPVSFMLVESEVYGDDYRAGNDWINSQTGKSLGESYDGVEMGIIDILRLKTRGTTLVDVPLPHGGAIYLGDKQDGKLVFADDVEAIKGYIEAQKYYAERDQERAKQAEALLAVAIIALGGQTENK